ncbi:DNA replication and repair protein RecF [Candidatus Saccharibacteria bacterium]|nr:DNA replication and repair protein RecF [Candidatus Saccharibacteria bacterium]MBQ3473819.1 DNA replication and repair protein RecF [Candidatus Saccharibacteria bacterium]
MIIKSIKLFNFRNHTEYSLICEDETSLILGENGSGKTSVLEAIYILTRGKSFRATDPEILKRGTTFYRIEIEYNNGETSIATYDGNHKTFLITDKKSRRLPKKNKYPVVLFQPSDLNLISHSPSRRRDYFDRIFSQFNENYATNLSRYEKALKQRNELLKNEHLTKESVFSWNILLAKYGVDLYNSRNKFIQEINSRVTDVYRSIAENNDEINIIYKTDINSADDNEYLQTLERNFEKDSYLGHTSFGVHRDDYIFEFNHKNADGSASRGESRSIILALKFIEADLIYQKTNLKPIILLDDVFSELDETRRKCLIKNFKNNQVIITSVENITQPE